MWGNYGLCMVTLQYIRFIGDDVERIGVDHHWFSAMGNGIPDKAARSIAHAQSRTDDDGGAALEQLRQIRPAEVRRVFFVCLQNRFRNADLQNVPVAFRREYDGQSAARSICRCGGKAGCPRLKMDMT